MLNKFLLLMGSLQFFGGISASLRPGIEKASSNSATIPTSSCLKNPQKKVCFSEANKENRQKVDNSKTPEYQEKSSRLKDFACSVLEDDIIDCCCSDCGQAVRFLCLGCVVFCTGYRCGISEKSSFPGEESFYNCPKMK